MSGLFSVIALVGFVAILALVVTAVARRLRPAARRDEVSAGADVITYLLLTAAVMVFVFSVASLGRVAFPDDPFVFEPERQVATSLASIAVSAPISVLLWNRQRKLRLRGEGTGGFVVYLTLVEGTFTTAFVLSLSGMLQTLFTGSGGFFWTDILVYGLAIGFHEYAVRDTPLPRTAYEIPRTVGAAVGFIPLAIGVYGVLYEGFAALYDGLVGTVPGVGPGVRESLALILTGLPVWWYRWLHRWRDGHGPMRRAWATLVAVSGMAAAIGALVYFLAATLAFLLGQVDEAARSHFSFLPTTLATGVLALGAWHHHRQVLGSERTDPVRFYEYNLAALGLFGFVIFVTLLVTEAATGWGVGVGEERIVEYTVSALASLAVWWRYWSRGQRAPRAEEAASTPRRLYLLVAGIIMAVAAAVSLITVLVQVFQAVLGVEGLSEAVIPLVTVVVSASLAAVHLLRTYARDRTLFDEGVEIQPFDVTVVTSHPGPLATRFPRQARVRVIHRADELGVVTDEMADEIVAAVDNRSAVVWVDEAGFRIAHIR